MLSHRQAWILALLTFVGGDVLTTLIGLRVPGVIEAHPVGLYFLELGGAAAMLAAKFSVLSISFLLYRSVPAEWRLGVPIGLSVVGLLVTVNNLTVIAIAVGS